MLEIRTGCRLHFGLMELCRDEPLCFGGLGMMLSNPSIMLRMSGVSRSGQTKLDMPTELKSRARFVIERRVASQTECNLPAEIEVVEGFPLHSGLGAGTQFASALALGLEVLDQQIEKTRWRNGMWHACRDAIEATCQEEWLAQHSGRGLRSAIGLTGFLSGGLILDSGYSADGNDTRTIQVKSEGIAPDYRVVTICPSYCDRISGDRESNRIESLGQQPNGNREVMLQLAETVLQLAPDATAFDELTMHLDHYMSLASDMFRVCQGGLYNGPRIAAVVQAAKASGLKAVGQSSWGPTVFGFARNQKSAEDACCGLAGQIGNETSIVVSQPATAGSRFRFVDEV